MVSWSRDDRSAWPPHRNRRGATASIVIEWLVFLLTMVFALGIARKWFNVTPPPPITDPGHAVVERPIAARLTRILVMGMDSVDGTHRTDTLMLVAVDPVRGQVAAVSIPRDTRVLIGGHGSKINQVKTTYGIQFLRSWLEDLFEISIDRYVAIDYQAFVKLIDAIGGVEVQIDRAMHYDDNWANLHIHFEPGRHHLDGRRALEYVRFRADAQADLGRIQRQQAFVGQIVRRLQRPDVLARIPELIGTLMQHVDTDAGAGELIDLALALKGRDLAFVSQSLPGVAEYVFEPRYRKKISYFLPTREACVALAARHFADFSAVRLDERLSIAPAAGTASATGHSHGDAGAVSPAPTGYDLPNPSAGDTPEQPPAAGGASPTATTDENRDGQGSGRQSGGSGSEPSTRQSIGDPPARGGQPTSSLALPFPAPALTNAPGPGRLATSMAGRTLPPEPDAVAAWPPPQPSAGPSHRRALATRIRPPREPGRRAVGR